MPLTKERIREVLQSATAEMSAESFLDVRATARDDVARRICDCLSEALFPPVALMELWVTEDCNLRCDYCFVKRKTPRHMSRDVALRAMDFLIERSRDIENIIVLFFGGEPLLRFDLIEEVTEYATEKAERGGKRIAFDMTTNGTLFDERVARSCRELKIKYLLSIDGLQADHDRRRHTSGGIGSFQMVMERLPVLKHFQPWQGSRFTLWPDMLDRTREGVEYLFRRGVNQFIIGPATGIEWTPTDVDRMERAFEDVLDFYLDAQRRGLPFRMTIFEHGDVDDIKPKYEGRWGCGAGRGRLCVSVEGAIFPCSKLLGVTSLDKEKFRLGDVWNGLKEVPTRKLFYYEGISQRPQCAECSLADYCNGCCPATNWEATGSLYVPPAYDCRVAGIYHRLGKRAIQLRKERDTQIISGGSKQ